MKQLAIVSLTLGASFCLQADAIPVSANRFSQARASVTDFVLSGTPQDNLTGPFTTFGTLAVDANAFVEVLDPDPFGTDRRAAASAIANQHSTLDANGLSASIVTGVGVDQRGTWYKPSEAFTRFDYEFELASPHTFNLSVNCNVNEPQPVWTVPFLAGYNGPGGFIIMTGDHSESQTGQLPAGVHKVSFFAGMRNNGTLVGDIQDSASAAIGINLVLTPVPDEGSLWPLLVVPLAGLTLIKRKKV